jgi:cell division protein FtsZ
LSVDHIFVFPAGSSDIIVKPGLINVDFADVRAIMSGAGTALMGIGIGQGKTAAQDAAEAAISSPLLDSTIENAKGVVFNISGGPRLSLNEVNQAARLIYSTVEADANVIFGALVDDTLEDNISITVLATGFKARTEALEMYASTGRSAGPPKVSLTSSTHTPSAKANIESVNDTVPRPSPGSRTMDSPSEITTMPILPRKDKIPDFLKNLKKGR